MPKKLAAFYALFTVSGFCGLIYESIWAKYLKLFLGHAAYAQTVVLVVFIGGMAVGAWLCGRYAKRIRQPLLFYAGAELLVGLCGIAFHPVYGVATSWAYDHLLAAACEATGPCFASSGFAALLILPQSILLGSTFPLMTAGILRLYADNPGRKIALLYFLNSIGAVAGVLISTFVLVPWAGLPGASLTAGLVNAVLALAVYLIARWKYVPPNALSPQSSNGPDGTRIPRLLLGVAALTGLSSFVYEVVWIRLLSLVLGASTHAFEIMLASFILGLALGGLWIRRRIDRLKNPLTFLAAVQIVMGLLAVATVALANESFDVMAWMIGALAKNDSGYILFNLGSGVIAAAIMSPPAFFAGMTLPLITYMLYRGRYGEESIGRVYSANTLGSILGVILAIHIGLPLLGVKWSLIAAATIDVGLGIFLLTLVPARHALAHIAAWSLLGIGGLSIASTYSDLDPLKTASGVFRTGLASLAESKILFHRDGKTSTVDVVEEQDGGVVIRTNGKPDASVQMRNPSQPARADEHTMTLTAALPLAHHPNAETVAVIGFGSGMTTSVVLSDPTIRRVDTIEIEPAMVEGARNFLPLVDRAFHDSRSRIVIDDAKSFFARSREQYDVIISEPSNPWVSGVASLFTEEFYLRVKRYLKPGGVFAQWLHIYEFDVALLGSITTALGTAFPEFDVYAAGHGDLILIARNGAPVGTPGGHIFELPEMRAALKRIGIEAPADINVQRVVGKPLLDRMLSRGAAAPNSDYFPYVDLNAPRARFKGSSATAVTDLALAPVPVMELLEGRFSTGGGPVGTPSPESSSSALRSAAASQLVQLLSRQSVGDSFASVSAVPATALSAFRTSLIDCASVHSVAAGWNGMVEIAAVVNPGLPATVAERFWTGYEDSICLQRLPKKYRAWITLFKAVAQRNARQMIVSSEALLEEREKTAAQIEYLVLCATTGYLAEGRMADAKRVLDGAWQVMPQVVRNKAWFRLERLLVGN